MPLTAIEYSEKKVKTHPMILSPEETLKTYLNAFIAKNINTVMAYLPDGRTEQIKKWRERMKIFFMRRMTERKHIKAVIGVKLAEIKEQKNGKLAFLEAKIETSPKFSGSVNCDPNGKCVATYKWSFRQYYGKGPWFFDGGGF
jgi:hypothetical protein